jgi:hypothetical protein
MSNETTDRGPRGYRWDAATTDAAAARIVKDVGDDMSEGWKRDPRDIAQAVLEIYIAAGEVAVICTHGRTTIQGSTTNVE